MNRHQSNPFLSDWDDDEVALASAAAHAHPHGNSIFDSVTADTAAVGGDAACQDFASGGAVRRSSCSQVSDFGGGTGGQTGARPNMSLYRRNMSSFEAASSLQQYEQQFGANKVDDLQQQQQQRDLIAKMTADFQSAIQTSDKQFDDLASFNPFDPFETITDDDSLPLASPAATATGATGGNPVEAPPATANGGERPSHMDLSDGGGRLGSSRLHDSIDDDEDELVSTPVRNIKSSPSPKNDVGAASSASPQSSGPNQKAPSSSSIKATANDNHTASGRSGQDQAAGDGVGMAPDSANSIEKATLFASLLASAENAYGQLDNCGQSGALGTSLYNGDQNHLSGGAGVGVDNDDSDGQHSVERATGTHVIKGSPTLGDDRPVSFFDPFETVIDKDALTSLMSETQQLQQQQQKSSSQVDQTATSAAAAANNNTLHTDQRDHGPARVAESASIETVIENKQCSSSLADEDNSSPNASDQHQAVKSDDTAQLGGGNGGGNGELEASGTTSDLDTETVPSARQQDTGTHYDASMAIGRPSAGITAPQPTPAKTRPLRQRQQAASKAARVQRRGDNSDSSSSSDEDDRIQIVIRASKVDSSAAAGAGQFAPVPLLPPPPSKSSMKQARERGQVEDMPSPIMGYKSRQRDQDGSDSDDDEYKADKRQASRPSSDQQAKPVADHERPKADEPRGRDGRRASDDDDDADDGADGDDGQFVIPMTLSDNDEDNEYGKPETPLYDEDTSYVLEEYPQKYDGPGWEMMLRYPPKKKLTANRFWKKIFVKLAQVPLAPDNSTAKAAAKQHPVDSSHGDAAAGGASTCWALQIFDHQDDKKPMQEIPIQATYTVSEISSQLFDQFGKIFTIKLQYIFYKERVGVRQGQLARFIHTGHIGSSTTSGGHGVDPISIGAIKRMGAPIEHSPQISQIIKLGCANYEDIKQFKESLEDCLFRMPIHRDRALTTYKTEEVQMAVRDETYVEVNQIGTITRQLARVRLFFLSFLNGTPVVEVGINDIHRQGKEVVGRMDILPVVTEEWIRLEAWELHSTVDKDTFERPESRLVKLSPPDATFFELLRFRVRPPRNRELPLQISANMSVTRTRVSINCDVMVPGCVSRKHGQIPCENIAIRVHIPECWIYFFREEKHFRMGSKKSVNRRPGKVKGIERFLGGGASAGLPDLSDESSLIEVTSGQAKYEHHHHAVVWRAARWPKESQSAYVQNTMKIRLPLTAYDKMPDNFYDYIHVEYTMPATTVSHTTLRSISVNPCDDEPPEKYVKYAAKYEYKVKMRLSVNLGGRRASQDGAKPEASPIVIMKPPPPPLQYQPDDDELEREKDVDDDDDDDDDEDDGGANVAGQDKDKGRDGSTGGAGGAQKR